MNETIKIGELYAISNGHHVYFCTDVFIDENDKIEKCNFYVLHDKKYIAAVTKPINSLLEKKFLKKLVDSPKVP